MRRNIFFDLDGTLINAHKRLYQLFCDLIPESELSFDDYWNHKKNKISHEILLSQHFQHQAIQIEKFQLEWMKKIEDQKYLDIDVPIPGSGELLEKLYCQYNLYAISHRQSPVSALYQIDKWNWRKYFKKVLITNQKIKKADLLRNKIKDIGRDDVLVGDTGEDISTAKQLQIISVGVLSGFLNMEKLNSYKPDYIFDSVADINFQELHYKTNNPCTVVK